MSKGKVTRKHGAAGIILFFGFTWAVACAPAEDDPAAEGDPEDYLAQWDEEFEVIMAQVEGLSIEERREVLVPMAHEAGGEIVTYGWPNGADVLIEKFNEITDLEISTYGAIGHHVFQRLLEERQAGLYNVDVYETNAHQAEMANREGVYAPLDTPATDQYPEDLIFDNYGTWSVTSFIAAWNAEGTPPSSWEDVLTNYGDQLVMELRDYTWFETLLNQYFIGELGWSNEEAIELFREAVREGAQAMEGHTLQAELVAGGEYEVGASLYHHSVQEMVDAGAPIEWQPAVEPIVSRPAIIGIVRGAQNIPGAILWVDFWLSSLPGEGQDLVASFNRTPASQQVEGGLPEGVEALVIDLDKLVDEQDVWEPMYWDILGVEGMSSSENGQ